MSWKCAPIGSEPTSAATALKSARTCGGIGIAHRVGHEQLVGAGLGELRGVAPHVVDGHAALVRAAERGREAADEARPAPGRQLAQSATMRPKSASDSSRSRRTFLRLCVRLTDMT